MVGTEESADGCTFIAAHALRGCARNASREGRQLAVHGRSGGLVVRKSTENSLACLRVLDYPPHGHRIARGFSRVVSGANQERHLTNGARAELRFDGGLMNQFTKFRAPILGAHQRVVAAALALAIVFVFATVSVPAQTYSFGLLHSFSGAPDGESLLLGVDYNDGGLTPDAKGNLYGTTRRGGAHNFGTVFKMDKAGIETVLYSFCSQANCADGSSPYAALALDPQGKLYGTTPSGGAYNAGTVFRLDSSGTETVLYNFCSQAGCIDGASPSGALILGAQGKLYGTTFGGGAYGAGTIFEVSLVGDEIVLHSFCSKPICADGSSPNGAVVEDARGNLYGTTIMGGADSAGGGPGHGTVFKVDTAGNESVLYNFAGIEQGDGEYPNGGLALDAQGNLYGTTYWGGSNKAGNGNGLGTVFKIDSSGHETVLHSFGGNPDGANPLTGLARDTQGNLYGTTYNGGDAGGGTIFELTPSGNETVIYSFGSRQGGNHPSAGIVLDAQGNLYGVAYGGAHNSGAVYELWKFTGTATATTLSTSASPFSSRTCSTSTRLTSSESPSLLGGEVTFTAYVTASLFCHGIAQSCGGSVDFYDQGTYVGSGSLNVNTCAAIFTDYSLTTKLHRIKGVYSGWGSDRGSSGTITQIVDPDVTTTTLSSSLNPSTYGQAVAWTASVSTGGNEAPTGRVRFLSNGVSLGAATLNASSVATLTKSREDVNNYSLTAVYLGDPNNAGSTSPILNQVIQQANSSAALSSSPNPSTQGQSVTFTATITAPMVVPTGSVTFTAGTTVLGTVALSGSGRAKFTTSTLAVGSTSVTATYTGNSNIVGSSTSVTQTVEP